MAKKDLTGDMKSGLDGLLSPTKKPAGEKRQEAAATKIVNETMKEYLEKHGK